jgi:hypothetical protein
LTGPQCHHIFICVIFDSHHSRLLISKEKFDKTTALLGEVMQQHEFSPRGMAKLRGKFGHPFRCIEGVAPFLVPFNKFIGGPDSVSEWDECKVIPHSLSTTMGHLFTWLPRLQPAGAEMWPLDPATLLFRWENGLSLLGRPLVVVYWGASPYAVGVSIRTRPEWIWKPAGMCYDQATSIVTFSDPLEAQVHRESAGSSRNSIHLSTQGSGESNFQTSKIGRSEGSLRGAHRLHDRLLEGIASSFHDAAGVDLTHY